MIIPAAFAFVADTTSDEDRTRGMAQLSAAASIGFVIGPAIGGLLGGIELPAIGLPNANFSLPFYAAAGCALLALVTLRWLEEPAIPATAQRPGKPAWTELAGRIGVPLAVAMAGQVAVALFETTFALHARTDLGMGLVQIGVVFMVCGLMMLVVQLGVVCRRDGQDVDSRADCALLNGERHRRRRRRQRGNAARRLSQPGGRAGDDEVIVGDAGAAQLHGPATDDARANEYFRRRTTRGKDRVRNRCCVLSSAGTEARGPRGGTGRLAAVAASSCPGDPHPAFANCNVQSAIRRRSRVLSRT